REHLLRTARALLEAGTSLDDLGLNALAREAAMTKSNVYRYFESREALLLELLHDEWTQWFATLTSTWTSPPPTTPTTTTLRALCAHLATTLVARPLLCTLTAALPSVLEHNIGEDMAREFKLVTLLFFDEVAGFIGDVVPALAGRPAWRVMQDGAVVLTGLWPHVHPAPSVQAAIDATPALSAFVRDAEADLARLFYAVAFDLLSSTSTSPAAASS
ncbi:MAG TPA: TetR family transcriptional regulator, partial [Myxococcota bacterium]